MNCQHHTQDREADPETQCHACKCEEVNTLKLQIRELEQKNAEFEAKNARLEEEGIRVDGDRDRLNRLNSELVEALKAFLAADNGGFETRHAAENTYCPDCANDSDSWTDQTEHHAGCKYLARIEAAKAALAKVSTPEVKREPLLTIGSDTDRMIECGACGTQRLRGTMCPKCFGQSK